MQLTGFQRYMRDLRAQIEAVRRDYKNRGVDLFEELQARGLPSLHDVLEKARTNPNRKPSLAWTLYNAPDHQAFLAERKREEDRKQEELAERFRKAQEQYQEREREWEQTETASNMPKFVSIGEMARQAQEQAFAEANPQPADFIERICGPGSNKPSGAPRKSWMD